MLRDNPEIFLGLFTLALGVISLLNTSLNALLQRRRERRERTASLYRAFYAADHYRRTVAPVYRLMLKWRALPQPVRQAYHEAVRFGWSGATAEPEALLAAYVSPERLTQDPQEAHFRDTLTTEVFTEHEALTVFLYFWSSLDEMLQANLLDRRLVRNLFAGSYGYYAAFLKDLRAEITPHVNRETPPVWIAATERLDAVFTAR